MTIGIYLILVIMGWFSIYGAVYNFEEAPFWDFSFRYGKQLVWIGCAILIGTVLLMLDSRIYNVLSYVFYGFMIFLLILTIIIAPEIKGSRSWLVLGPVSLQPAEFAKTATCLALAKYMSNYGYNISRFRHWAPTAAIILLPMLLIILQQETGSALVYCCLLLVLYREGMNGIILFLGFLSVVIFILSIRFGAVPVIPELPDESYGLLLVMIIALVIQVLFLRIFMRDKKSALIVGGGVLFCFALGHILYKSFGVAVPFTKLGYVLIVLSFVYCIFMRIKHRLNKYILIGLFGFACVGFSNMADKAFDSLMPHQQTRIKVTLGMENDPKKAGYNVNQSMIAIGSGGLTGKGFLNGTQTKLKYVPEQDTDFIFCTVGEEHGFIGTATVLGLFLFLLIRLIMLAERQRSLFSRIYGYCVASIFFFHLFINIGMVTGLTPVIGIPLPFFSYGGSSLWGFTILLFIFLRLDASRTEYFGS